LRKLPDEMLLFCKKKKFRKFVKIWGSEIKSDGTIRLKNRKTIRLARTCPAFLSMEDGRE
jgi:hypothetical protein